MYDFLIAKKKKKRPLSVNALFKNGGEQFPFQVRLFTQSLQSHLNY